MTFNSDRLDFLENSQIDNKIINGGFDFWQRGNEGIESTVTKFYADRFRFNTSAGTRLIISKENDSPVKGSSVKIFRDIGFTQSVNAIDMHYTSLEANFCEDLIGKEVVYSFYTKATKAMTSCFRFYNTLTGRTYLKEYTIDQANTWERKFITFTLEAGSYNTGVGAFGLFANTISVGSNYHGVEGWQNGDFYGTANQDHMFDLDNSSVQFAGIMLYEKPKVEFIPEFKRMGRNIQEEQNLCYRYFWDTKFWVRCGTQYGDSDGMRTVTMYPVTMRTIPSVTFANGSSGGSGTDIIASSIQDNQATIKISKIGGGGGGSVYRSGNTLYDAEL